MMRMLRINKRPFYYSNPTGETVMVVDEFGNETGEVFEEYTEPEKVEYNISAAVGQESIEVFGSDTSYARTIAAPLDCKIVERARVWVDREPAERHNYVVRRVAESLNSKLLALTEV